MFMVNQLNLRLALYGCGHGALVKDTLACTYDPVWLLSNKNGQNPCTVYELELAIADND